MKYYAANVRQHWGAPYHVVYFAMENLSDARVTEFCRKEWNLTERNRFTWYRVKPAKYFLKAMVLPQSNSETFWNYSHSIMVTL